jgi:hypothetical protein
MTETGKMEKHTPTPWRIALTDDTTIIGPNREIVGSTWQDDKDYREQCDLRTADAAFIVRAVNSYDALKAENERLRMAVRDMAVYAALSPTAEQTNEE